MTIFDIDVALFGKEGPCAVVISAKEDFDIIFKTLKDLEEKPFRLLLIEVKDWNDDLSPWYAKKLFKGDKDCGGHADEYLEKVKMICNELIEDGFEVLIAGYSLAGLFALYSAYNTDLFKGVVSASGSLWFPHFIDYTKNNKLAPSLKDIYLSLGDKESHVKNTQLQTTETNTLFLYEYYKSLGLNIFFEFNEGNHFKDSTLRLTKGIKWMIDNWSEKNRY